MGKSAENIFERRCIIVEWRNNLKLKQETKPELTCVLYDNGNPHFNLDYTLMSVKEMNGLVVVSQSVNQKLNPLNSAGGGGWGCNRFAFYNKHL